MARSLCKVMGRKEGGGRAGREKELEEEERPSWAEWLDAITVTADMIEKMPFENRGVCLISVHDGLSLFRRFSVIHPSLISPFKIVFAQLHMYLHTQTCMHAHCQDKKEKKKKKRLERLQCKNKDENKYKPRDGAQQPRYTNTYSAPH